MPRPDPAPAAAEAPAFPLRVAAIDAGSNAIRYAAAEFASAAERATLDEARHAVRLGHEVFLSGRLAPDAMDAAVRAFADFRGRMEALGVRHYRAVATSATREARNGAELVERVRRETGIELEVITGTEEARLVYLGVAGRVPLGDKKWILVDLGGGSVEVSLVDSSGILWTESHTVGSVRLLEELSGAGQEPGRFQRLLREYAASLSIPVLAQQWNPAGVIATGGNIDALARLTGARGDRVAELPLDELRRLIDTLGRLSFRQRVEELGLKPDRADVIVPAAMVYERVAALAGADRILVPNVGLRDGLLADIVDDVATHQAHEDRKDRHARAGAVSLGRRYLFNERHALHVRRLAASLFDQLAAVHGMGAEERRMLLAAAVLHDIGIFVGYKKHHKHSHYLISQSELPEFTARETEIIANLARYHRKGIPAEHHENFTALPAEDRQRVLKLASLLRLADGMDREHRQAVRSVRTAVRRGRLVLELEGDGDLLLERWAVRRKAGLFTDTFGMEVVVGEGSTP